MAAHPSSTCGLQACTCSLAPGDHHTVRATGWSGPQCQPLQRHSFVETRRRAAARNAVSHSCCFSPVCAAICESPGARAQFKFTDVHCRWGLTRSARLHTYVNACMHCRWGAARKDKYRSQNLHLVINAARGGVGVCHHEGSAGGGRSGRRPPAAKRLHAARTRHTNHPQPGVAQPQNGCTECVWAVHWRPRHVALAVGAQGKRGLIGSKLPHLRQHQV